MKWMQKTPVKNLARPYEKCLYLNGRLKSMELRLLDRGVVDRLLDAPSVDALLSALGDTTYGERLARHEGGPDALDSVLEQELSSVRHFILAYLKDPLISQWIAMPADLMNIKVALKALNAGEDLGHWRIASILDEGGSIPIENLTAALQDPESRHLLPLWAVDAVDTAMAAYEEDKDPQTIDRLLDVSGFRRRFQIAGELKNRFLEFITMIEVDLTNITTYVRLRSLKMEPIRMDRFLIEGGRIPKDFWMQISEEELDSLPRRLSHTDYSKVLDEGFAFWDETKSFARLEVAAYNYVTEIYKAIKHYIFGVEAVLGFLRAKEIETRIIRAIWLGKRFRLDIKELEPRLADLYI